MKFITKLKRAAFEWKVKAPIPLDGQRTKNELDGLILGLRCMMAQGGYKVRPPGMADEEIKQRGDQAATLCANLHVMVRCAEEVLLRHGLKEEYVSQMKDLDEKLTKLATMPKDDQLIAAKAMLKAVHDGDIQRTGGEGQRTVDQAGVRADSGEGA